VRLAEPYPAPNPDKEEHLPAMEGVIHLMLLHARGLFRESLARLLSLEPDIKLVAECANVGDAMKCLGVSSPDVILFDLGVGEDFISAARDKGFDGKFLAIAEEVDAGRCARAISRGASGVFLDSDSPGRLVQAIRLVEDGGAWLDRSMVQVLAERYPHTEDLRIDAFANREQAVLRGILGGLTNRKIANQIGVSEASVKATLQQLFDKTGVRTRSQLLRMVLTDPASPATE
jgi:DNA-binding NarL/FixJ family response regulator